jgi:hypothetical protein
MNGSVFAKLVILIHLLTRRIAHAIFSLASVNIFRTQCPTLIEHFNNIAYKSVMVSLFFIF